MLPILHKTPRNKSINQSINRITIWLMKKIFCLLIIEIPKRLDKKKKEKTQPNNSLTKRYASKVFVTNFILFAAAYVFTVVSIIWNFARY